MAQSLKILVSGDVEGNYDKLYSRINKVNEKSGPFDYLFCVGNFFDDSEENFKPYKLGNTKVPVPTFVLGPNNSNSLHFYPEVKGCELAPDVTYLGKRGVFTTISGLTVAYVSGVEDERVDNECQITLDDISRVRNACIKNQYAYKGVDILLTSEWPADVSSYDINPICNPPEGSKLVSNLVCQIKPLYHFFGLEKKYYERSPYKNQDTGLGSHLTRAIALANVGNDTKNKWLFAMNLTPLKYMADSELYEITTDTTECPYSLQKNAKPEQFFYDMNYKETVKSRKRKNINFEQHTQKIMNVSQNNCWFCIASLKFEKHLVVSIGEEAYLALAKGGLVSDHVMILPISHYRTISEMSSSLREEIRKFKIAIRKYCASKGKSAIFFDRNYKTPHYQIHAVPISSADVLEAKRSFIHLAEQKGFTLTEVPENADTEDFCGSENSYFYVEIENHRLIHAIKKFFPLQFAREVLAHKNILNVPHKVEWKNIQISKEEETKATEEFRNSFKLFDFTV